MGIVLAVFLSYSCLNAMDSWVSSNIVERGDNYQTETKRECNLDDLRNALKKVKPEFRKNDIGLTMLGHVVSSNCNTVSYTERFKFVDELIEKKALILTSSL
ncbi:MAG: hypothetical protein JXA66_04315 [Oligoflexia bacterium]|nr:hypothetical protein [Oligoflexia bacterium]